MIVHHYKNNQSYSQFQIFLRTKLAIYNTQYA